MSLKRFWNHVQLLWVSLVLLAAFALMLHMVTRWNRRWDFTPSKIYSLADDTKTLLGEMHGAIEVFAFYPHDDPARPNFEVFLRQCMMANPNFRYGFYDPDRVPTLTRKFRVKEIYTVVVGYEGRYERITQPTEQNFMNALVRLLKPKKQTLCFVTGHGEAELGRKEINGYRSLAEMLESYNYETQEIILTRDEVPSSCDMVVVAGPRRDFTEKEFEMIEQSFKKGMGILFLVDPMDPGQGSDFVSFFKRFGLNLGADVIVDKASRAVGGDFLVAMVSQYVMQHSITKEFQVPTMFPVARSIQPAADQPKGLEVIPLGLTSGESWAETNLPLLEKGEARFESSYDLMGPIPIAAAIQPKAGSQIGEGIQGRLVVVGDSDFLSNAYLGLAGNFDFMLNTIQWLTRDDRVISLRSRVESFRPFVMDSKKQILMAIFALGVIPGFFIVIGLGAMLARKRFA